MSRMSTVSAAVSDLGALPLALVKPSGEPQHVGTRSCNLARGFLPCSRVTDTLQTSSPPSQTLNTRILWASCPSSGSRTST